jgi:hypothetical protein
VLAPSSQRTKSWTIKKDFVEYRAPIWKCPIRASATTVQRQEIHPGHFFWTLPSCHWHWLECKFLLAGYLGWSNSYRQGHMFIICWFTGQATRKRWSGGRKKIKLRKIQKVQFERVRFCNFFRSHNSVFVCQSFIFYLDCRRKLGHLELSCCILRWKKPIPGVFFFFNF